MSLPEKVSCKKYYEGLKIRNFQRKTPMLEFPFKKVAGLKRLLKRDSNTRIFL